ncbi:MAG TPA: tRNA preQ1(34) S-adenosylmethionine ribosyltransferase-isomerase QueA [Rhodospirillales bacterium]|nr:tRNA preQ1(34) S-adenosylmethionine ribosyltransferase-isomerase QueA [Rhodospirillales bacterium]
MLVDDFDFDLPKDLIAQRPVSPRDRARLLLLGDREKRVTDLPGLLNPGDMMVFNDTRVIPARLKGKRGQAGVEVTLHKRLDEDRWDVFARPAKKLKVDNLIQFAPEFSASVLARGEGGQVTLRFNRSGADLMTALKNHGSMPLPPYIKRAGLADGRDKSDYQTLFAEVDGAVAAPTAGLHFTDSLIAALDARGIKRATLTLHVGAGTFLPVKTDDTDDHVMHAEWGHIDAATADAINATRSAGGRIIAVGTTSLRLLESAALEDGTLREFRGDTDIFITPGYKFKIVDMLMTNFHLPRSTLFMLVSAFAGFDTMKKTYELAIAKGYRFYSYGDACLLERSRQP